MTIFNFFIIVLICFGVLMVILKSLTSNSPKEATINKQSELQDTKESNKLNEDTQETSNIIDPLQGIITGDVINLDGNPFTPF